MLSFAGENFSRSDVACRTGRTLIHDRDVALDIALNRALASLNVISGSGEQEMIQAAYDAAMLIVDSPASHYNYHLTVCDRCRTDHPWGRYFVM